MEGNSGIGVKELRLYLGCCPDTIRSAVKRLGIERKPKHIPPLDGYKQWTRGWRAQWAPFEPWQVRAILIDFHYRRYRRSQGFRR